MTNTEIVVDQLDGADVLHEALGTALPKLQMFHDKLKSEGSLRGIIGPRDVSIIWERHILNSASIVPFIQSSLGSFRKNHSVADVGSGGGFPGIVAACMLPDVNFSLIEPMERRVVWLNECLKELSLSNVQLVHHRSQEVIERISTGRSHNFQVVTCRAVAPLTKLVPMTLPLLASGGSLIALKGRSAQQEIEKAKTVIKQCKGIQPRLFVAPVGKGLDGTHVVLIDKQ